MAPVETLISAGAVPACRASANSRCFRRSDIDSVMCVGALVAVVEDEEGMFLGGVDR